MDGRIIGNMDQTNYIEPVIYHYLKNDISEDEMQVLTAWLHESEANKELFFRIKDIYELRKGGNFPDKKELDQSWNRLMSKMSNDRQDKPRIKESRWVRLGKYAAVAVICIGLTLGLQMYFRKDQPSVFTELDTESGPRMSHITLPDGTKVTLNASTRFRYPDRFGSKTREVFLDGEAYFNVKHDTRKPFIVRTKNQEITVLGTKFNMMDYSTDDYAITTLIEGSIQLSLAEDTGKDTGKIILKPGQQAYLNKDAQQLSVNGIKIDTTRIWVNKIYHFRDESLSRITQRLEKIYGIKILITDNSLKDEKYTGTFALNQEIEDVLKIINYDKQFLFTKKEGNIIITKK